MATAPSGAGLGAQIVNEKYNQSVVLANTASAQASAMQTALEKSIYGPAKIDVKWQTLPAPNLPPIPNLPELPKLTLGSLPGAPSDLTATLGDVKIDDFVEAPPKLNFPAEPVIKIGSVPAIPSVAAVAIPDAPNVTLPDAPVFLAMTTHSFGGINLHEDWLDKLDDIPELSLLEPAPFNYSPGARYASQLLDSLKATLNARIHGGTGLAPEVEQQIWGRARDRETALALAREQEALRGAEALGYPLPSGVLAGQLADARREYLDKLSGLSRDIAIKQAELEQENVKNAIQAALQLDSTLLEDCYKLEVLAIDAAKAAAYNAIQAHNSALEQFKALLAGYQAYAQAYDTMIKAEMTKVEVFKALLSAEETKANINKALVDRYKAEIEGRMAVVEIYKARVGAAQTLAELERTNVQVAGEQIKAFVATVNAETAKADLYKTTVQVEGAKQEAYATTIKAYSTKVGAQAERARVNIAKYQAHIAAKGLEWDGYKSLLNALVAEAEISARSASLTVDGYRLGASAAEAQAGSYMRRWEADIKQYEAGQTLTFNVAKVNADAITHANDARMEAAKVGLATSAQRVASSWAMVSADARVSDSTNTQINL